MFVATVFARRTTPTDFEWDKSKARSNRAKHGIDFVEATTVFGDPLALTGFDPDHSIDEDRFVTVGATIDGNLMVVTYTDRGDRIRIISARKATRKERSDYQDGRFP